MASFNQNGATLDAKWFMSTHMRTAQPESLWIATMLVFKNAINDKYFFTPKMSVRVEISPWSPTYQGRIGGTKGC